MWKRTVLELEYNEYAEGIIDPSQFYTTFFILLKTFQVSDGATSKWAKIITPMMTLSTLLGMTLLSITLYNGINTFDIPLTIEAGTYLIILFYKLMMISTTKLSVCNYHSMQRIIKEDFLYICTSGERYRKKFFLNQIETRKIYKLTLTYTILSVSAMAFFTVACLIHHLLTHEQGEGKRPLLFPCWLFEVDVDATPVYEIVFLLCNICVISYGSTYCFIMGTQVIWIREIVCKADIVIWSLQDVMDGIRPTKNEEERNNFDILIKKRMKEVIKHHQSMYNLLDHYAGVFKKLLMLEQKLSAPVVCLSAYCAAEKWDMGEFNAIPILLCIAAVILVFIPSYLVTLLSIKVSSICYACWDIPFWNASPVIRPYLVLIMQRSLRALPVRAPGFEEVSLETFSNKMVAAYSYFNMLRHINK